MNVSLNYYLIFALLLFLVGFFGFISAKNFIKVLISIEFMLCAAGVNFVALNNFLHVTTQTGQVFAVFINAVGACEVGAALTLIIALYRIKPSVDTQKHEDLGDK